MPLEGFRGVFWEGDRLGFLVFSGRFDANRDDVSVSGVLIYRQFHTPSIEFFSGLGWGLVDSQVLYSIPSVSARKLAHRSLVSTSNGKTSVCGRWSRHCRFIRSHADELETNVNLQ